MSIVLPEQLFKSLLNQELKKESIIKLFPAETVIIDLNSFISSIPIVLSGSIKVIQVDEKGREVLLYYIKPGESCIMSFMAGISHSNSKIMAIVEEDAKVLLIPTNKASEWIKKFPEWTEFIFNLYHKRFDELLSLVNTLAFEKLDMRLLDLLKQKSLLFKSKNIITTHQQLADELAVTREAVSRVLKHLENEKKVKLSRNKITLM